MPVVWSVEFRQDDDAWHIVLLVAWLLRSNWEASLEFSGQRCRSNAGSTDLVRALGWRRREATARATDPVGLAFPLAPR